MDFTKFQKSVAVQFDKMSRLQLFEVNYNRDEIWDTYLKYFPEGTNPIFRERTEHDCNSCKSFIRQVGGVVVINADLSLTTIWDVKLDDEYQAVADAMAAYVRSLKIDNFFLTTERFAGRKSNTITTVNGEIFFDHFYVDIPVAYVKKGDDMNRILSDNKGNHQVFSRAISSISVETIGKVKEFIQEGLYRGTEHTHALDGLEFHIISSKDRDIDKYCWLYLAKTSMAIVKIRNTSIGTLLTDIQDGMREEAAIKLYEMKVAPANYRRPTAIVTASMVASAKDTITELGYLPSMDRRYARLTDVSVNNVIFADRSVRPVMKDVFSDLLLDTKKATKAPAGETISIEEFIDKVVPTATGIDLFVGNDITNNMVSLVAPCDLNAKKMFNWDNLFSWSYAGEFADSIKERVKQAGGCVDGFLRCSLSWFNYDDLDLRMREPKYEIYYGNKGQVSPNGGKLDVDMNAGSVTTRNPVENIIYATGKKMRDGIYSLFVNQFNKRESTDVGFEVEIELDGTIHKFSHEKAVPQKGNVVVADIQVKNGVVTIHPVLASSTRSKEVWGIRTQEYVPVSVMMFSPNYWDGQKGVGNKHYFFMLKECKNDGTARGFFNEFLNPELSKHRKVFELLGSKNKLVDDAEQLSGAGFSSTISKTLSLRVQSGTGQRIYSVTI